MAVPQPKPMPLPLRLPDDVRAASVARDHVARELAGHPCIDDIVLAASELATNAVVHGSPPNVLELARTPNRVRVGVVNTWDGRPPTALETAVDETSGRGLAMVEILADQWGWDVADDRITVWAEFSSR